MSGSPLTTTTNTTTDITSNVSNLIDSVKNFDATTLMMIGGSIIMLFIIFSKTMGNMSSFVDNIPIVWVVKKIIGSDSGNSSISVGQPLPDNPTVLDKSN